jgi:hypothetical protein
MAAADPSQESHSCASLALVDPVGVRLRKWPIGCHLIAYEYYLWVCRCGRANSACYAGNKVTTEH